MKKATPKRMYSHHFIYVQVEIQILAGNGSQKKVAENERKKSRNTNCAITRTCIPLEKMHISIVNSLEITKPKINFTHFFGEKNRPPVQRIK